MSFAAGTRLGPYEITGQIGAGGMGVVWRATDTNLGRQVAIKVLPDGFAHDPERLARFEREAKTLASLSHPNIAIIHGFEKAGGVRALVMELVEGPTLADRIEQGPFPVDEALPIARQIAEALEAAHEQGIIHRDLKPGNIKVRPDGTVKVLDFGLAKAMELPHASPGVSQSPTITTPAMTRAGVILGTAAYMSPEQAKGRAVDKRSDLWAFGAVLFEMLAGQRAFAGDDVSDTLANVLKTEPDWERLPASVPPRVRQVIRACLQKNAKQRIGDGQDVRLALDGAFETAVPLTDGKATIRSPYKERLLWISIVGLVALAAVQSTRVWLFTSRVPAAPEMRFEMAMPSAPAATIAENELESLAISPDGRSMVFVSVSQGRSQMWLRSLDSKSARPLAGSDFAILPFWSPDSRSVAFFADGQLKRIDIDGGSTQILARAPFGLGGTWSRDGTILLTPLFTGPIYRIPAAGAEPVALTQLAAGQTVHRRPRFLPDGSHFFYYAAGSPDVRGVYIAQLNGPETRRLLDADTALIHQSSGQLLFISQGTLYAQGFDMTRLALIGNRSPVAEDVAAVTASDAGIVAYRTGSVLERRQFVWFDRSGREIGRVGDPESAGWGADPSLSPNGRYVAVARTVESNRDIWLLETTRGVLSRFTSESAANNSPRWSPNGRQVVFNSNRSGVFDLYVKSIANPESDELLLATPQNKSVTDWSRDGRFILFRSVDPALSHDLWALPLDGEKRPFPVVRTGFVEPYGQFSPDGQWVAYQSNESGRAEVYVQPFPGPGARIKISTNGGAQMRWRHDGKELFYLALDGRLMAVPIRAAHDGGLEPGDPAPLFAARVGEVVPLQSGYAQSYDISPDGQRFLMNTITEAAGAPPIEVILNWPPKS